VPVIAADVRCKLASPIARKQSSRRSPAGLVLEIDAGQPLAGAVPFADLTPQRLAYPD